MDDDRITSPNETSDEQDSSPPPNGVEPGLLPPEPVDDGPIDALPLNPWARRLVIAVYILIVFCVILGLLLSLVWSGILAEWFDVDFSLPWPEQLVVTPSQA